MAPTAKLTMRLNVGRNTLAKEHQPEKCHAPVAAAPASVLRFELDPLAKQTYKISESSMTMVLCGANLLATRLKVCDKRRFDGD